MKPRRKPVQERVRLATVHYLPVRYPEPDDMPETLEFSEPGVLIAVAFGDAAPRRRSTRAEIAEVYWQETRRR